MDSILNCQWLPFEVDEGPWCMAKDEAMLQMAINGTASLRFYAWSEPWVSLGYFQPVAVLVQDPLLHDLPFVRRPTGGDALVHHHEITYCLALPPGAQSQSSPWAGMHTIITKALKTYGVKAKLYQPTENAAFEDVLCFEHFTEGDVLIANHKVVGSAQRRSRKALLQHGGILLRQSKHTPTLPGICDLSGMKIEPESLINEISETLASHTGWELTQRKWLASEKQAIIDLAETKYATDAWNCKR